MQRYRGLIFIEVAIVAVLLSLLFCFSLPLYRQHAVTVKTTLFKQELIAMLATAKLQAFVLGKTLILEPLRITATGEWQQGLRLCVQHGETLQHWIWPELSTTVLWYGFHSRRHILIEAHLDKLAMNGYFQIGEIQLVVNRFGRVRES